MLGTVLLTITQGTQIIGALTPIGIAAYLELKKLFSGQSSDQPFEIQVQVLRNGILTTIDETDALIAEWKAANPEA